MTKERRESLRSRRDSARLRVCELTRQINPMETQLMKLREERLKWSKLYSEADREIAEYNKLTKIPNRKSGIVDKEVRMDLGMLLKKLNREQIASLVTMCQEQNKGQMVEVTL